MNATESPIKPATTQPAKLAPKLTKPAEWTPPHVRQSQTVNWYPDRHTTDCVPAIVTKEGDRAINVAIIEDGAFVFACKQGVRYRGDPDTEIIDRAEQGCWDFAVSADVLNAAAIREIGLLEGKLRDQAKLIVEILARLDDLLG